MGRTAGALVSGGVDGADAEDDVVFRDGELDGGAWNGLHQGPGGGVGGAPEDFVGGVGGGAGRGFPGEFGVVVEGVGEDFDVLRLARGGGEGGERGGVHAGDVGDVSGVDVLEEVAVLDGTGGSILEGSRFGTRGLVLVIEVLLPLGDAHGGEAFGVEAGVVAAAEGSGRGGR